jgi:nucleoside-diphosphate-sugar epimerase
MPRSNDAILVMGASGFLGSLVAATALRTTTDVVVLPLRQPEAQDAIVARLAAEAAAEGHPLSPADLARIVTVPWPPAGGIEALVPELRRLGVRDILHCAGCLSYFNVAKLQEGNLELTRTLLDLGRRLAVRRFVFLSTAYSSGFMAGTIPERLHEQAGDDPTDYTRTKREAEWMVAQSGLPWVIVRPSIVIGDSRDGRYGGKPYGLYQLWTAGERYLAGAFPPVLHVVAARQPVNFLHQDAFMTGFWAAYRELPDGTVLHLASRDDRLPSMRDLWRLWMGTHGGPREVHLYERLEDVPLDEVDPQLRLWLDFTAVNNEIASVRWNFELDGMTQLRARGHVFPDVTLESVATAQARFVRDSVKLQEFVVRYRAQGSPEPRFVAHDPADAGRSVA